MQVCFEIVFKKTDFFLMNKFMQLGLHFTWRYKLNLTFIRCVAFWGVLKKC